MKYRHLITLSLIIATFGAHAGMGDRPRRGPPPEALSACSGKVQGDPCSFTGRFSETLTGTCFAGPMGGQELACRPKPPKEAFEACAGKNENDSCTVIGKMGESLKGTCHTGPMGEAELACIIKNHMLPPEPDQMPEGVEGGEPQEQD